MQQRPHRPLVCLQNVLTKYVQPEWVVAAAAAAQRAGSRLARVHCRWQQTSVATGRLSCSDPNLQARVCGLLRLR